MLGSWITFFNSNNCYEEVESSNVTKNKTKKDVIKYPEKPRGYVIKNQITQNFDYLGMSEPEGVHGLIMTGDYPNS